jgi:methyltransferase (TIGR00027 family)
MREGTASQTARAVAARRLEYQRAAAPYGDPDADDALARDVAAGLAPRHNRMHEYIRARTAFFDRAVVHALDQGITQVVIGAAGYDGRALRYAKPGTRWFEVDHPATQADKRERLDRLGLDTGQVRFIPADFTTDPVAAPLRDAGLDTGLRSLFLFEGIVVYLELAVTERVLAEFRAVAAPGSLLAVSVSVTDPAALNRARFEARVAGYGEPARTTITAADAAAALPALGWHLDQVTDRQRSAGLLLARAAVPAEKNKPSGDQERRGPAPVPPATRASVEPSPGRSVGQRASPARAASPGRLPLSALLSQALVAFTIEADNEAEHRLPHRTTAHGLAPGSPPGAPWLISLVMWANCLRHLPEAGLTLGELRDRARTGTNLDGMRRWRYVTIDPEPPPSRRRPGPDARITPTRWGIAARDTWEQVTGEVESRWRGRLGAGPFDALRAALAGLADGLDPALPDCLPVLGYGLLSRPERDRAAGREHPAAAGPPAAVDPAAEAGGATVTGPASKAKAGPAAPPGAGLPLWALLSRPLLAFALRYESEPGPSLAVSANVLRVLTEGGLPAKDIPALGGVSKESVAMALGVLAKDGLATEGPDPAGGRFRSACLTASGAAARDRYPARAAAIEAGWRAEVGADPVAAVRAALEPLTTGDPAPLLAGLTPYPDNWRARSLPPASLPHYPMTLHRGGYPDGS